MGSTSREIINRLILFWFSYIIHHLHTFPLLLPDHQLPSVWSAMYNVLIFIVFTPNLPIPRLSNLPMFSFSNVLKSISFKFTLLRLSTFSYRVRSSEVFNVILTAAVNNSKGRSSFHQTVKTKGLDLVSDLG